MTRVFVSYCHKQDDWVWQRLVPVLKAGGAEVLIDRERFSVGKALVGQMDDLQDQADRQVLVLSPDYLASDACNHEMRRAIDLDPEFTRGIVIPVLRADCELPECIRRPDPLYSDFCDDGKVEAWDQLTAACDADLGVDACRWLSVRAELRRDLEQERSVNLVVSGKDLAWRPLIDQLAEDSVLPMTRVDLYSARTIDRPGLLASMLSERDGEHHLPAAPADLVEFQRRLISGARRCIALLHFDQVQHRDYGIDLFTTLRYLVTEERKLVLLIQSRTPFGSLLHSEQQNILSHLDIATVELRGRE